MWASLLEKFSKCHVSDTGNLSCPSGVPHLPLVTREKIEPPLLRKTAQLTAQLTVPHQYLLSKSTGK